MGKSSAARRPLVVGVTADRRWEEQASLLRRRGLDVVHGPTMRTVDLAGDERLREVTESIISFPPEWLVATTGMGMKQWFEAADGWGRRADLLAALASPSTTVIARGAKSTSAVRQAGLEVAWRAPGESMTEVVDHLRDAGPSLGTATVAVQLFDPDDHPATAQIRSLAGRVVEVPVYRWRLPVDLAPAEALVRAAVAGDLGALTFTSQPAVRFLFFIADRLGLRDDLVRACNDGTVVPVCIGPVCAEAGTEAGLTAMVWPDPFRLPPMVRLVAEILGSRASASDVADPLP
ncbi:MAG TPA: uroporphyrinogen-III synthase [Acidimicrobiales bacterium]|nr:uroporphyrinogen-III synthase [Acidimicrobiales bacterium]